MLQLLKNAKIYDGTGSEPYRADILLDGDRIAKIAGEIDLPADSVIDLTGKSVSSGFIDGHSHNDWFAIKKEPLPYFAPFLRQGITTFITGNCGVSEIGFEQGNPYTDKLGGGIFGFETPPAGTGPWKRISGLLTGKCPAIWLYWPDTVPPARRPAASKTGS